MKTRKLTAGLCAATVLFGVLWAGKSAADLRIIPPRAMVAEESPAPPGGDSATIPGVHVDRARKVGFDFTLNDGAGFRWNIQHYGSVGQGTNYAYSGGLYCQVRGSNVQSAGYGWVNEKGDEIEIGPYSNNNLRMHRRVKIYRDRGMARWLDIFENPTKSEITVPVQIYSATNYTIGRTVTSSGKNTFDEKDWAFITETSGGNNVPVLLHVVCGKRSKIRPTVQIQNNQIYVRWNLTVPAGDTAILCYFESQGRSVDEHLKTLKDFRVYTILNDLSPAARKRIVNFSTGSYLGGMHLDRSADTDKIVETSGDAKFGQVLNEKFVVETFFDTIEVPAARVLGMSFPQGVSEDLVRVALTDGQILCGIIKGQKLKLKMSMGSTLDIPMENIRQWSYKISADRPEVIEFAGPAAILRTGDLIAFDTSNLDLKFVTRHGTIQLNPKNLLLINMDNPGHGLHKAEFLNGSRLGGMLDAENITLKLTLGPRMRINRNLVAKLQFAPESVSPAPLTNVKLTNGDELFGRLGEEQITIRTDYDSKVTLHPRNIKSMSFSTTHLGRAVARLWDGSVLRGQLMQDDLKFEIKPGPQLAICPNQCLSITRPQALPPREVMEKIEKLVGQLGAESYKDRQDATEELVAMGREIIPLLQKYLNSNDPEVQQRIRHVVERLGQDE